MNYWLLIFFRVLLLLTSGFSEENITEIELTDDRISFTWSEANSSSITVKADDGYQIKVEVLDMNVHGENGDYVTVKSVNGYDDDSDCVTFTYTVSGNQKFLYDTNNIQASHVKSSDQNSFLLQFTRVGQAATTTTKPPTTTSTEALPTAAPEETDTITVYLYGHNAEDFETVENLLSLKKAIAAMGADYCKDQYCPLNGSISSNNVKIKNLEQCPIIWENSNKCINLTFALPIAMLETNEDTLWEGYQLKIVRLEVMWDDYAEKYVKNVGLKLYRKPNVDEMFISRIITICLILVLLVILILIWKAAMTRISKRRRLSDTFSIMGRPSDRTSQASLSPHFLQELPPLFSNDFFPMYNMEPSNNQAGYSEIKHGFDDSDRTLPRPRPRLNISSSNDIEELDDTNV